MGFYEMSAEDREIYLDLFCEGRRPRVLTPERAQHPEEYKLLNRQQSDEEKAVLAYEV